MNNTVKKTLPRNNCDRFIPVSQSVYFHPSLSMFGVVHMSFHEHNHGLIHLQDSGERAPVSVVWTTLPVISAFIPLVGHVGIGDSVGVTYDFSGPYQVCKPHDITSVKDEKLSKGHHLIFLLFICYSSGYRWVINVWPSKTDLVPFPR